MSWLGRNRVRTPIGMDCGAARFRGVELIRQGRTWLVDRMVGREREASAGETRTAPFAPGELSDCLDGGGFRGRNTWLGLATPELEYTALELPEAMVSKGGEELNRAAGFEIQRLLTGDRGAVETRFWTLPATRVPGPNAFGVAVSRSLIDAILDAARQGGAECIGVDAQAHALCRLGTALRGGWNDCVWGVLDLGHRQTRLVLCVDEIPVLVRAAGGGGAAWTERIAGSLSVSLKAAEVLKREHGLSIAQDRPENPSATKETSEQAGGKPLGSELGPLLRGVLRNDLNEMAAEIKRSYEYVLSCYPARRAADLILVGGGARLPGLSDLLGGLLGIPVRAASELIDEKECRLDTARFPRQDVDEFAVSIGLVLDEPRTISRR